MICQLLKHVPKNSIELFVWQSQFLFARNFPKIWIDVHKRNFFERGKKQFVIDEPQFLAFWQVNKHRQMLDMIPWHFWMTFFRFARKIVVKSQPETISILEMESVSNKRNDFFYRMNSLKTFYFRIYKGIVECIFVGSSDAVYCESVARLSTKLRSRSTFVQASLLWSFCTLRYGNLTNQQLFVPVNVPFLCSCLGLICLNLMRFTCFWMSKKLLQRKNYCTLH